MQQSTAPAPTGLENSTYLLGFTCALGCRASEIFDISSDFFSIYIYIYIYICKYFVMQGKCNFMIFQGLP